LTESRLDIGKQLKEIVIKVGGRLNTDIPQVLAILSQHDRKIKDLITRVSGNADINHPIFEQYEQEGQDLLRQLFTI
jgi:hypothetical protein